MRLRRLGIAALAASALLVAACGSDDGAAGEEDDGTTTTDPSSPDRSTPEGPDDITPIEDLGAIPQLVRELQPSVVAVVTDAGEGSGVVYDEGGTVVTNNHVVEGADQVRVAFVDGERVDAEVQATDPRSDLAVLQVDREELPAATFASELPEVGELAVAMGNPFGFENSVTAGIISGLHRAVPGGENAALVDLLQTDAPISPGNSGGALVGADGEVMGINVAYLPPGQSGAVSIGFAIPSITVVDVVDQLLETGEVRYSFLGITPQPVTPEIAEELDLATDEGVIVQSVVPDGPADEAGIEEGDVIVRLDDQPVRTLEDFLVALRGHEPGEEVTVDVERDGEERSFEVRLAERPPE